MTGFFEGEDARGGCGRGAWRRSADLAPRRATPFLLASNRALEQGRSRTEQQTAAHDHPRLVARPIPVIERTAPLDPSR